MTRTAIYRHFDAAGRLLYVGITDDMQQRAQQHATSAAWWTEVARTESEECLSRLHALALESVAIEFERPLHNQRGGRNAGKFGVVDGLADAIARDGRSMRAISLAAGFGPNFVHQVLKEGKEPGVNKVAALMAILRNQEAA